MSPRERNGRDSSNVRSPSSRLLGRNGQLLSASLLPMYAHLASPSPFHLQVGPLSTVRVQSSFDYAQRTKDHAAAENERVRDMAQVVSRGNNSIVDGANDEITVVITTRTC